METVPSHLEIEIVTVGADEPVTSFADVSRAVRDAGNERFLGGERRRGHFFTSDVH